MVVGEDPLAAEAEKRVLNGVAGVVGVAGDAAGILAEGAFVAGDHVLEPGVEIGIHRALRAGVCLAAGWFITFLTMSTGGRGIS